MEHLDDVTSSCEDESLTNRVHLILTNVSDCATLL